MLRRCAFTLLLLVIIAGTAPSQSPRQQSLKELDAAETESLRLAQQWKKETAKENVDDVAVAELESKIRARLQEAFQLRQELQQAEINQTREDLRRIESRLNRRGELAQQIVDRRLNELLHSDDLAWQNQPPSNPQRSRDHDLLDQQYSQATQKYQQLAQQFTVRDSETAELLNERWKQIQSALTEVELESADLQATLRQLESLVEKKGTAEIVAPIKALLGDRLDPSFAASESLYEDAVETIRQPLQRLEIKHKTLRQMHSDVTEERARLHAVEQELRRAEAEVQQLDRLLGETKKQQAGFAPGDRPDRLQIFSNVAGEIVGVLIDQNQQVNKDDVLLRLRNREWEVKLIELKAKLATEKLQYERVARALQDASNNSKDRRSLEIEQASLRIQIDATDQTLRQLQDQMDSLTIRAPVAGTIVTRNPQDRLLARPVEVGEVLLEMVGEKNLPADPNSGRRSRR